MIYTSCYYLFAINSWAKVYITISKCFKYNTHTNCLLSCSRTFRVICHLIFISRLKELSSKATWLNIQYWKCVGEISEARGLTNSWLKSLIIAVGKPQSWTSNRQLCAFPLAMIKLSNLNNSIKPRAKYKT